MHFSVAADQLTRALRQGFDVARNGRLTPILANILIRAGKESVTFTAFDGRLAITSEVPAKVYERGEGLLSYNVVEFVETLKGIVIVSTTPTMIVVKMGEEEEPTEAPAASKGKKTAKKKRTSSTVEGRFHMLGQPADYPNIPTFLKSTSPAGEDPITLGRLNVGAFVEQIKRVEHAIGKDEARPNLVGLELSKHGENFRAVATDGRRLALLERATGNFPLDKPIIIPLDAVVKLRSILGAEAPDSDSWEFGANKKMMVAQRPGLRVVSLLVDGAFPEYERVVPTYEQLVTTPRESFRAALKRVCLMCDLKNNAVEIAIGTDDTAIVNTINPDRGEASDTVQGLEAPAEEQRAKFRHSDVLDALEACQGESVQVGIGGVNAALFRSSDGFTAVVMPTR